MLKRENRLTKDKEIDGVFKKGRSGYNKLTGIKVVKNNLGHNRFVTLINLKVSKKAVERNKIKRQIREAVRLELDNLKQGHDCVIIALPPTLDKQYKEIEKSIKNHFIKLKLYK